MPDGPGNKRESAQRLQRFIFAFQTHVANCEEDLRSGRLEPEPTIDLFRREVTGLCGYGFVVVGLEVVANALERDARGKSWIVRRSGCVVRIARGECRSLVHCQSGYADSRAAATL